MNSLPTLELSRRNSERMVAGVAGGVADTLGVGAQYVRAAFLTLATVWGLGVLVYVGLWLYAYDRVEDREPPELDSSQRLGLALAFVALMALIGAIGWWPAPVVVFTMATLAFGAAALTDRSTPRPLAALIDPGVDRPGRARVVLGVGLLVAGLTIFASAVGQAFQVASVFLAVALTALGVLVAFGPLVRRLLADLARERGERIRQEERAEVAAHLHDSVLQTLALIQRSDDPAKVTMLARHQEAELRNWLYGTTPLEGVDLVSTALRRAATRVEEDHQVPVEVVTVGDYRIDDSATALIGAATEAMVNAAKHSGASRISLYFEAGDDGLSVFVTDQGKGFDLSSVGADRRGITASIINRVERAGGVATIVTDNGEGTEVHLSMPVARP